MLSLFWYLPVALFIGLVVRKLALNLNRLFDNRLADTDLMITEHNEGTVEPLRLTETAQQIAEEFPELAADGRFISSACTRAWCVGDSSRWRYCRSCSCYCYSSRA